MLCSCISASVGPASINSESTKLRQQRCQKSPLYMCSLHSGCIQLDIEHSLVCFDTTHNMLSFTPSASVQNPSVRLAKRYELTYPNWEEQTQAAHSVRKTWGNVASINIAPSPAWEREEHIHHKLITQNVLRVLAKKLQNLIRMH